MKNTCKILGAALVSTGMLGAADAAALDAPPNSFTQRNLVSDVLPAAFTDPNLKNAWGILPLANGLFWTANAGTDTATLYQSTGRPSPSQANPLIVSVPGGPTGIAQNTTSGFVIQGSSSAAPANLIFVTLSGTIQGFNAAVEPTSAVVAVDFSSLGSVFTGAAIFGDRLFATDFANGLVEVFDSSFNLIDFFSDPFAPDNFVPYNATVIGNSLFVTFAEQEVAGGADEVAGAGLGFVDQFSPDGTLLRRFTSDATLNAPWGMARAPSGFGPFAGALLVGNFGDGRINAFSISTGRFLGQLQDTSGAPIVLPGLWGLAFGRTVGLRDSLFFASGPNDEENGLAGVLIPSGS